VTFATGLEECEVIAPHEWFFAATTSGDAILQKVLLGDGGLEGLAPFWQQLSQQEWVQQHPALLENRGKAIPLCLHGDDAATLTNRTGFILSVSS
jgi:hypothetical protein